MASQVHPQSAIASATPSHSSPSPNSTGHHMGVNWHDDPSTPPADTHTNLNWELSQFSMDSHLVMSSGGPPAGSLCGNQAAGGMGPTKHDQVMTTGLDASTPPLTDSFSSVESDSLPTRSAKSKNTRIVSNLTPEQLERKRSNDRRAQRAIRERTKRRIVEYQNVLAQKDEMIMALSRRVHELEEVFRQGDSQRCGRCMNDIGSDGRGAGPLVTSDPPSRCPSLQGSLPGSHRGSFTPGATSPQSLPSIPTLPSNDRSYSVVIAGVADTDTAAYGTAQDFGAPPRHGGVAWPGYGRGALQPTLPSSLTNTGPSPAMSHDSMAGHFYSSPSMMEHGTATKLRHLLPYPSPTQPQRNQAFDGPMVHDESYEARSLAMAWGDRI